ncbi:hypothetical protein ZIOFF_027970 [Zingiber officinale]|uniref:Uncharacterized protein n=1 Tax=Zingiber officinale TaxID=94328 RepID=A0A8J5GP10_ZINOF|nr:hypothetical protein ZIOFF_027970 [Zingiber officinale]
MEIESFGFGPLLGLKLILSSGGDEGNSRNIDFFFPSLWLRRPNKVSQSFHRRLVSVDVHSLLHSGDCSVDLTVRGRYSRAAVDTRSSASDDEIDPDLEPLSSTRIRRMVICLAGGFAALSSDKWRATVLRASNGSPKTHHDGTPSGSHFHALRQHRLRRQRRLRQRRLTLSPEDDFEFTFPIGGACNEPIVTADELFSHGRILPVYLVFDHSLALHSSEESAAKSPARQITIRRILVEDSGSRSGSISSSEADDLVSTAAWEYRPRTVRSALQSPEWRRECTSTETSRRWKLWDTLFGRRSHSDGKNKSMFLEFPSSPPLERMSSRPSKGPNPKL